MALILTKTQLWSHAGEAITAGAELYYIGESEEIADDVLAAGIHSLHKGEKGKVIGPADETMWADEAAVHMYFARSTDPLVVDVCCKYLSSANSGGQVLGACSFAFIVSGACR